MYQELLPLENDRELTIQQRFRAFHELNPWVADALIERAREYKAMGWQHIGIKHLIEILRWEYARQTRGSKFKINNNFPSRYVRLITRLAPDIKDMFNVRELRAP